MCNVQVYLKQLLAVARDKDRQTSDPGTVRTAVRCMCGLLSALPHFNYTSDLLQAVVPLLVSKDLQIRDLSCSAIRDLLMSDQEGTIACEAVQLVADLVKRRKCVCPLEALRALFVLKLRDAIATGPGQLLAMQKWLLFATPPEVTLSS